MNEILAPLPRKTAGLVFACSAVVGAVIASRYLSVRKINGAERLAEALLDTDPLREVNSTLPDASETVLAGCATYWVHVAYRAAEGVGVASGGEDATGQSRTHRHPYTHAVTTVLTEAAAPEQLLTYAVEIPDVGEVRGTRRVGSLRVTGLSPARPAPDAAQVTLGNGYTAQIETVFEVAEFLVTGKTRLFGQATLRDNRGNVGLLNVAYDGGISGTITRDNHIVGRFGGTVRNGASFHRYELPPAPPEPTDPTPTE